MPFKMKKLLKKPIFRIIDKMAGRKKYQNFFFILYQLSLKGFNLRNIQFDKNGELNVLRNIARFYKTHPVDGNVVCFDIGANMGNYSLALISEMQSFPKEIHAFEPLPIPFELLNKFMSGKSDNYQAHNFGLGNINGSVKFFVDHETSELGSIFKRDMKDIDIHFNVEKQIQIERADDFCKRKGISHIHFMKIDVEGAEVEVLKGASELLQSGKVDFIQLEFGAGNVDSKTYMKDFYGILGQDFMMFRILKDGLFRMDSYHTDYEIIVMGNYFAISKALVSKFSDDLSVIFNY
jgi:FkbM family methyltransferase